MFDVPSIDESLLTRLPLPLAQVFRRALNAKSPLEQHLSALYLAEVGLKLLASAAVVEYASLERPRAELEECLKNLARPTLGQWWEIGRRLTPLLADAGCTGYEPLRQLLLGRSRDDMPRAAGLDAVLRETLGSGHGARTTVRLSELFDRLVTLRNKGPGHGAPAAHSEQFHQRLGGALLSGLAEVFGRLDVLAGKRLVYVSDVRQSAGVWSVQWLELVGANARRLPSFELARSDLARLPDGDRVYLQRPADTDGPLLPLYPLILYEPDSDEVLLLNGRQGREKAEWLCYTSGRELRDQAELNSQHQALLARLLRIEVGSRQVEAWAERSRADDPPLEPAPPAQRMLGEFELLSVLGRGGMGVVYRAWQPSLGRQVALKKLLRTGDKSEQRFAQEIRALGRVDHPNLVKIHASGSDGDQWFYAMELIEGTPLDSVCEQLQSSGDSLEKLNLDTWHNAVSTAYSKGRQLEQPLSAPAMKSEAVAAAVDSSVTESLTAAAPIAPFADEPRDARHQVPPRRNAYVSEVVELIRQTAEAAHALHEAGVVHRDIKPGNIMLWADGRQAVLMDLGLAQLADEADARLTRTRQFVGTLRYASPEQIMAVDRLDRRTDVYSLGATLWELLTLRPLFAATKETPDLEVMRRIQWDEPERISKYHPRIAADLAAIVAKCLEKNPSKRYATAADLADDLGRWLRNEPISIPALGWTYRPKKFLGRHRRLIVRSLAAAGVAVVLGLVWCDAYVWPRTAYFGNYIQRYCVGEGFGRPLTSEQLSHRAQALRFTRKGRWGPVVKVEIVDSRGRLKLNSGWTDVIDRNPGKQNNSASDDYVYLNGNLTRETTKDCWGREVWTFEYDSPVDGQQTTASGHYMKDGFVKPLANSGAAFVEAQFSPEGWKTCLRFTDGFGNPRPDPDGSFGVRYKYDRDGRPIEETNLGLDGNPAMCRKGYVRTTYAYDASGNLTRIETYGIDGQLRASRLGWAVVDAHYDQWGNLLREDYYDNDLKPTVCRDGYATVSYKYDDTGNRIESAFWDASGHLILNADGVAGAKIEYDDDGNVSKESYFGKNREPALDKGEAIAGWLARYENRRETIRKSLGTDGRPTASNLGYADFRTEYDQRGNAIACYYFDVNERPCLQRNGSAGWTAVYDAHDRQTEQTFVGTDHQPKSVTDGYATAVMAYDNAGNVVETAYLDARRRMTTNANWIAMFRSTFDDSGREVEHRNLGTDRQPTLNKDGITGWRNEYDHQGNLDEQTYLGLDDKPTLHNDGYASRRLKYDDRGREIEEIDLGLNGKPAATRYGVAVSKYKLDNIGNRVETRFFGPDGTPTVNTFGIGGFKSRFDEFQRDVELSELGVDGQPTLSNEGFARISKQYDERGNKISERYFGLDGQPCLNTYGSAGWIAQYDARGNETEKTNLGVDGRPARWPAGYAILRTHRDDSGTSAQVRLFGPDGQPADDQYQGWGYDLRLDELGREIEKSFVGADGHPILNSESIAGYWDEYNARGNVIRRRFFGVDRKPRLARDGRAGWSSTFDSRGHQIEYTNQGLNGEPLEKTDASARIVKSYDAYGNQVQESYLNGKGEAVLGDVGAARWKAEYDQRRRPTELRFFGVTGSPALNRELVARVSTRYDDRDHPVARRFFGVDDKPTLNVFGIAGWIKRYDGLGREVDWTNIGLDDKPVPGKDGSARGILVYDHYGRLVERQWFDDQNRRLESRPTVTLVFPDSPAERLGLKKGDVFLKYDNVQLSNADSFLLMRRQERSSPGKPLVIQRGETILTVTAPPGLLHFGLENRFQPVAKAADQSPERPTAPDRSSANPEPADKPLRATPSHAG